MADITTAPVTSPAPTPGPAPNSVTHPSAGRTSPGVATRTSGWHELRDRWPLAWQDLGWFLAAYVTISAVFVGLGKLVVGPLDGSVGAFDRAAAITFASNRTPALNDLSYWGSMLAETAVKIGVTAVVVTLMVAIWRRWDDALLVAAALILEASIFLTVTLVVRRGRPDVVRLDGSPVDSSFPSGHVAAAVVYGAFAIVVARHTARAWARWLAVTIVVAISLAVAWARTYRGMHFVSDVTAGALLGLVSLTVTWWIMRHVAEREMSRTPYPSSSDGRTLATGDVRDLRTTRGRPDAEETA